MIRGVNHGITVMSLTQAPLWPKYMNQNIRIISLGSENQPKFSKLLAIWYLQKERLQIQSCARK
jgi:hypothetical protein